MLQIRRFIANLVSLFIFDKRKSRNVKAIIKHGVLKTFKERRDFRKNSPNMVDFKYNLAIVAIMKNEGPYLREWIEFHKLMGVEKFYLYDNESNDDTQDILKPYIKSGLVDYTFFPGQKRQLPAYEDCISKHKKETKWLAVIDLDEFIVPVKDADIQSFLNRQSQKIAQFIIPWVIFGSNGHNDKPDGLVIENYTKRAKRSWLYKSIINPRMVMNMGCHEHNVAGSTQSLKMSDIRVHHYHCKSWAEYKLRAARGDAWDGMDAGIKKYQRECFDKHDLNEVVDNTAARFAPQISKIIKQ